MKAYELPSLYAEYVQKGATGPNEAERRFLEIIEEAGGFLSVKGLLEAYKSKYTVSMRTSKYTWQKVNPNAGRSPGDLAVTTDPGDNRRKLVHRKDDPHFIHRRKKLHEVVGYLGIWDEACPSCRKSPTIYHDLKALRFGVCVRCQSAWYAGVTDGKDFWKPASLFEAFAMANPVAVTQVVESVHFNREKPLDPGLGTMIEGLHREVRQERYPVSAAP